MSASALPARTVAVPEQLSTGVPDASHTGALPLLVDSPPIRSEWREFDLETWQRLQQQHTARATEFTAGHLARRARGEKHAIEDFLFTYYSFKPAQLAKWHPGAGVILTACKARANWRYYHQDAAGAHVDLRGYFAVRGATVAYVKDLLQRTLAHTPNFGCFGLHEWAMVYQLTPEQIRHRGLRLRLGHSGSDEVVQHHRITCSHFDAFRFFTPPAAPLNTLQPTRETQPLLEQSACLHAGMDIYKWITKLGPIVPGELLLDAFELARDIRYVDMQASPYDVSDYGLPAIPIETAAGKREYMRLQRGFAARGNELRHRVLECIQHAEMLHSG